MMLFSFNDTQIASFPFSFLQQLTEDIPSFASKYILKKAKKVIEMVILRATVKGEISSEAYSEPSRTSAIKLCKNS